jgi:hypothetical protein
MFGCLLFAIVYILNCERKHIVCHFLCLLFVCACLPYGVSAQKVEKPQPLYVKDRKLFYTPDSLGNRIPDFSYCGYKAGEETIPDVPNKIYVIAGKEDVTVNIQNAIDVLSQKPRDKNGFRGAVILDAGVFYVSGSLRLHTSGVVLRGSGVEKTTLVGIGKDRATLISIEGRDDKILSAPVVIADTYVPVNARTVHVESNHSFKAGDHVIITRPSTAEWIKYIGTDHFGGGITALGWKPGQRTIEWDRTVTAVNGNEISFDAPLTTALDKSYGGGTITAYKWPGRISNCGVENLQLTSAFDSANLKDEDHRWMAIVINHASDVWVRQVSFRHFAGSAVAVYERASRVTVEDCTSMDPISEIGGERRNTFFTAGQQTLFQRCYAEGGIHDFVTGFCAAGPNAFVQCESHLPYSFSGGLDSWSSGVLFDIVQVDGQAISYLNRGQDGQGAGWAIANSVLWNCSASRIDCYQPPGAQNWAFGSWSQFAGDGYWAESNNSIEPRSLYYAQLEERIGESVRKRTGFMPVETDATSSPTVEQAAQLTRIAAAPQQSLLHFIQDAARREPINTDKAGALSLQVPSPLPQNIKKPPLMLSKNGRLVRGEKLLTGARTGVPWWSGSSRVYAVKSQAPAITRFVPGRTGKGLTDDLDQLTDSMMIKNIIGIEQNYGLWYDRRRDDHERIRRMDGDVWPPFYELPFARSGKGTAWDGLSKYDLTKYNYWYWNRLKTFAGLADQKGLLLVYQHYFQHNIIEAGAHYADFPWRPANNINNTGFPEPVPYAGDKRIFMAEQFYDETHPVRRALHRSFIRQCLNNFADNNGVVHTISEEFTGPLHFVNFWIDVIKEWEAETRKKPLIALSVTKDVQDSLLADPARASVVDIIDIRYWHYQADGTVYAPKGGQSLAPRQHARLLKPKSTSPEQVYRAVSEYKLRFPGKGIIYSGDGADRYGWAVLMAGGSLPNVKIGDENFLKAVASMEPAPLNGPAQPWLLLNESAGYVVYDTRGTIELNFILNDASYHVAWVNAATGEVKMTNETIRGNKTKDIKNISTAGNSWVLWLKRK